MTVVEAAEYACLVLKGAHPDSDRAFSTAISAHLSSNTKMLRVWAIGSSLERLESSAAPNPRLWFLYLCTSRLMYWKFC